MGFEAGWSGGWPGLLSRPLGDTTKGDFTRWPELSLVHRKLPVNSVCRPGHAVRSRAARWLQKHRPPLAASSSLT